MRCIHLISVSWDEGRGLAACGIAGRGKEPNEMTMHRNGWIVILIVVGALVLPCLATAFNNPTEQEKIEAEKMWRERLRGNVGIR
jgi:hypothetical protein